MPSLGSAGSLITTTGIASTTYGKGNTTASGRSEAHFIAWFCNCTLFRFPTFLFSQRVALAILFKQTKLHTT